MITILSGVVGALIGAGIAFVGGVVDRHQARTQRKLDRGFDAKLERYTSYFDAVETLLKTIYSYQERGEDPESHGADVDSVPEPIRAAERSLRMLAPKRIREFVDEQFKLMPDAMRLNGEAVAGLRDSQDRLADLVNEDLGLGDETFDFLLKPITTKSKKSHKSSRHEISAE